jgi:phenylalanyl-tRNA synthetase alpha chain
MQAASLAEIDAATHADALEQARIKYLGRNGAIPAAMKQLKEVAPADRPEFGKRVNGWRTAFAGRLEARKLELASAPAAAGKGFDWSLPGSWPNRGTIHPLSLVSAEIARIFCRLGFTVADGPDIETRFNNFTALNTPDHHPSMDESDTFWFDDNLLLRTQTSPVQIRAMLAKPPPIRIITPGRTYRRDTTDATHSANFHQCEGLYVDTRPVSLSDLKATLRYFAREMMGPDVAVRFRPHFFPFTEPSVEVDFSCHVCGGRGCPVCKQSGWIEIMGAGLVDPRVFRYVDYDPAKVHGYAFGMGIERIAMIRYGVTDIRMFYENDVRFLGQFA